MENTETLKLLPKVEVSFQDDFSGGKRDLTLTSKYVFEKLKQSGQHAKINDKILFWEHDPDESGDYLCNIGEVRELTNKEIKEYSPNEEIKKENLITIQNRLVYIKLDNNSFFRVKKLD